MKLSKQEIGLLNRITSTGRWEHWMVEVIYLVPSISLIIFGVLEDSERSIFVGTGVIAITHIIMTYQQSKAFIILKGLCLKISDLDKPECKSGSEANKVEE